MAYLQRPFQFCGLMSKNYVHSFIEHDISLELNIGSASWQTFYKCLFDTNNVVNVLSIYLFKYDLILKCPFQRQMRG